MIEQFDCLFSKTGQSISKVWKRKAPSHIKKNKAKLEKVNQFFQELVKSSDDQRAVLYARIDKWWKSTPNYKRRRLVSITRRIGYFFSVFKNFYFLLIFFKKNVRDGATISLKSNN